MPPVLPETDPLIEIATRPLAGNAEQRLAAHSMLEETHIPGHQLAPETLARLEKIDARKTPGLLPIIAGIAAAVALVVSISVQILEIRFVFNWYHNPLFSTPELPPLPSGLTPDQRLLLGDPELPLLRQKELLYESDPENPAFYAEYMSAYYSEHDSLPPDYFETVARIAPENSFFLYYAAAQIGGRSYERKTSTSPSKPQRIVEGVKLAPLPSEKEHVIKDQAAFDEALSLIETAAGLPEFETYGTWMVAARVPLFPSETLAESIISLANLYGSASQIISLRKVADLIDTQAQLLSGSGEAEKFRSLVKLRAHFVEGLANNPEVTIINELVYFVIASATAQHLHWGADRLGLSELSEDFKNQVDALQDFRDRKEIHWKKAPDTNVGKRGSVLSGYSLPMIMRQVSSPPPIADDELKPLRLVDHEIASRLGITAAALIIALACIPVYFFRYHSPRPVRIPAIRLSKLLRPSDWAWIVALGAVAPIVVFLAINRFTPLGGRDYSLENFLFMFPTVHLLAILLNLLLAPAILIRWRLSKRLAPFGINSRPGLITIAVLFLVFVWALAVFPVVSGIALSQNLLIAVAAVPALWLANVFLNVLLAFIGKPEGRIPRVATTSALLPAYAVAIIALCLTIPLFTASEKHWMKQDTVFRINPDAPDFGAYEYRVATQLRKEANAILGID